MCGYKMTTKAKTIKSKAKPKTMSGKKTYCTVCPKWEIKRPEKCSDTLVSKSKKHYFCTRKCKERFEKTPEKFIK